MTDKELNILHHTLGISDPYKCDAPPYRNHFVAGEGHRDMPVLKKMVAMGYMGSNKHALCHQGDTIFSVTEKGRHAALATRPKVSRAKLRYRRFLDMQDLDPDLTFREFLTSAAYQEKC